MTDKRHEASDEVKRQFTEAIGGKQMSEPTEAQIKRCARCGAIRTDGVDSDICGSCADDLRQDQEAYSGQANSDTGGD